ncbi:sensor histidine kinase [Actinoplanes philippinensis]|nr:histidine kinase [Actinoplanes philippinensis]
MVTRQFELGTVARRGQLAVDGGIAVLAFVISLLPLTADAAPGWAFVVLAGNTLPLALRRQSPLLTNLLIAPSAVIFGLAGWPSPLVPVGPLVALHAIAAYGRRTHSYAFLTLALLAAPAVLMLRPAEYEPYEWLNLALAAVVAWLAGTLTAARRRETRQFEERMAAERALRHAETERATAESERATAESERATAEAERAAAESERAAAESERATAEARRAAAESERAAAEAERAAAEERNRIARDMHDVLGHSVAVMVVLAEGAAAGAEAGRVDPATLELIAATGRRTMADLRATLGPLRSSTPASAASGVEAPVDGEERPCAADSPAASGAGELVDGGAEGACGPGGLREPPGSGDIAALVATVRRAGTVAELRDELAAPIGGAAGLAAYRIVQEALTNALKHAPGAAVTVEMAEGDDGPWITVGNHRGDGGGPVTEGQGLRNMRERATAVGGTVEQGPVGDRWLVTLRLTRGYGR